MQPVKGFIVGSRLRSQGKLTAVSLFSGAGLSDIGYEYAGFRFVVQAELEPDRAALGESNFPASKWIVGDIRDGAQDVVEAYETATALPLDLLVATPPCQGMSSSNPSRGKRTTGAADAQHERNALLLALVPVAKALRPRVIVAENVRQILTQPADSKSGGSSIINLLVKRLPNYHFFKGVINIADYGVPQDRRRAVIVGVRRDQPWLKPLIRRGKQPWPKATHREHPGSDGRKPWLTVREWFKLMKYQPLDACSPEAARNDHALHAVPHYAPDRYTMVKTIPAYSGKSAYENDECLECDQVAIPRDTASCPKCETPLKSRPIVWEKGKPRIIKGFASSYRRIHPDLPAPTTTTNTSHLGGDYKIHPWENRVLSALECADLQTVPRWYDWSKATEAKKSYLVRTVVGEAFPPYFSYLHGKVLASFLEGRSAFAGELADVSGPSLGHRKARSKPVMICEPHVRREIVHTQCYA